MRALSPLPFSFIPHAPGRHVRLAIGFAAALVITVFAIQQSIAAPRSVTDARGRTVEIASADRIVSIGGAVTEILYALGAGDRVIARDQTSLYPPEALEKPDVGYMRALSAESVLSVKPDLILAVEGSGPKEALDLLLAASVPIVILPEPYSAKGIAEKITMIADVIGEPEKGKVLADGVEARADALAAAIASIPEDKRRRAIFLMSSAGDRLMAAGHHTAADAMLTAAGAVNPFGSVEGYKPASAEAMVAAQPASIVMMKRPGSPDPDPATIFALPSLSATPAAADKSLIVMDGLYLLGFGPRMPDAARDLAAAFYPQLALPAGN
ncbi:iron complex transport system substrate-binding protein [Kaistia soli DSM 19436]|uniref:Iron complex transport system substrate-binding protein n=1 Tax=Kaistia soli DSM 19436 TaxID=1122133 RepID=A0A1M5DR89_9HYPH|nr:ABC transporter substrate-binding protein [Kaistia soli]SHF69538.1 iron complex transport system substrate-binding protein [Kaistia soli DSM 19436]